MTSMIDHVTSPSFVTILIGRKCFVLMTTNPNRPRINVDDDIDDLDGKNLSYFVIPFMIYNPTQTSWTNSARIR